MTVNNLFSTRQYWESVAIQSWNKFAKYIEIVFGTMVDHGRGSLLTVDREIAGALSTSTRRFIHRFVYIFDSCHPFSSAIALVAIERRDESYGRIDHRCDTM